MLYKNYRFFFSVNTAPNGHLLEKKHIEQYLSREPSLQLVRIAIDDSRPEKSLSLLSKSDDEGFIKAKVIELLSKKALTVRRDIIVEDIRVDEEIHILDPVPSQDQNTHLQSNHCHHGHCHHNHPHHHENHRNKAALGLVWGIGMLIIAIGSFNIPLLAYLAITFSSTLMTLYLGSRVYKSAWQALRARTLDMSTLYTISTLVITITSILSLFVPGLPMMLEAAPLVLGFWHLSEAIEHSLVNKINHKLDVRDCLVSQVTINNQSLSKCSIKQLIPNDEIILEQGNVIPVDGILRQEAWLYTTRIDGSPHLKRFKSGDAVKAGMQLSDNFSTVTIQVSKTYQNSYLSLLAQNLQKANDEKAPIELFAKTVLKYFIPALVMTAIISGVTISVFFNPIIALQCVTSVLVSACPCVLSLITPMAVKIGMKKALEQGIHFKNGKVLQAASDIDTVVFDLNGTLTKGEITVQHLWISDKKFLGHIALLENESSHPVAKVIASDLKKAGVQSSSTLTLTELDKQHHSGIKALINGERFMIGNKDMLAANGINNINKPYDRPANGTIYVVKGSQVIGQISLSDPLRLDTRSAIMQLKWLGKSVHICTGADRQTAEAYGSQLGIASSNICANTVGVASHANDISKTNYIQQLRQKGHKVAMVGDAANDATAIAYANLGIAVRSNIGDVVTEQQAGIIIQQGRLFPIATAFDVAKKTKHNILQNLFISLTYNSTITLIAAGLFVAVGFTLNPVLGVAMMALESSLVLGNVYRFKHQAVLSPVQSPNNLAKQFNTSPNKPAKLLTSFGVYAKPLVSEEKEPTFAEKKNFSSALHRA